MIKFDELEGYQGHEISSLTSSWCYDRKEVRTLFPWPKEEDLYESSILEKNIHVDTVDTSKKLYLFSQCNIPRRNVREKFKVVLKPEKSDVVVIPKVLHRLVNASPMYIWVNHNTKEFWIFRGRIITQTLKKGDPWLGKAEPEKSLSKAKFYKYGIYIWLYNEQLHYYTLSKGGFTYIFENELSKLLPSEGKDLTMDIVGDIRNFLKAQRPEDKFLGLKILSELNYTKYPNLVQRLLRENNHHWNNGTMSKYKQLTSIKYMLDYMKKSYPVTAEEYNMLVADIAREKTEQILGDLRTIMAHTNIKCTTDIKLVFEHGDCKENKINIDSQYCLIDGTSENTTYNEYKEYNFYR